VFIVLSVIGIVLTTILRRIQQRVLHWMPQDPAQQRTINV
jgi:NitT/TauT family transport system permease protein